MFTLFDTRIMIGNKKTFIEKCENEERKMLGTIKYCYKTTSVSAFVNWKEMHIIKNN
jgi:hypothetical protein